MYLLGIDLGTSSIKVSVVDVASGRPVGSAQYPDQETEILAPQHGWAEQSPDMWWDHVKKAIAFCIKRGSFDPKEIKAIGVAYQMHGLVIVNMEQQSLRNSIIWCDSRAVAIGDQALKDLGRDYAAKHLLNSPGNFTASKLAWVKANEPAVYSNISNIMLPGDFIAMKLTGSLTTSSAALSEGIFWDFKENRLAVEVLDYFGFDHSFIPEVKKVFAEHGKLRRGVAAALGLKPGIPVSYKAGDQPNNALSLDVTQPGEVAATAGTSGVIYGVTDHLVCDRQSRVNTFAHVNHCDQHQRLGVLLCINGTGSMYRWVKNLFGEHLDYPAMNAMAAHVAAGSEGLQVLPFGNGAERMLGNQLVGGHLQYLDLNIHTPAHVFRAVQEGIAFAFRYGLDIMRENGMQPSIIRAGRTNLFQSEVFTRAFVNITGIPVELYHTDGSYGAAIGAGIGAGIYSSSKDAFSKRMPVEYVEPEHEKLEEHYLAWKNTLDSHLKNNQSSHSY